MPLLAASYDPPFLLKSGQLATIYSGLFRRVVGLDQLRERMEIPDGDFMDLDWSYAQEPSEKVVILLHGLEGHAQRPYITGAAMEFNAHGIDACAVNFRGCSGEPNRLFRSYHSGATEELETLIHYILAKNKYTKIYINGFSLGGNVTLKYFGENNNIPSQVKGGVAISVPCDLHDSLLQLLSFKNILYAKRFLKHLLAKLKAKQATYPELLSDTILNKIKNLKDFDDLYTSKAHGFNDAMDYYKKCSSLQFIPEINKPVLLINAANDSFLGKGCYPKKEALNNPNFFLQIPEHGGHVGFYGANNITFSEKMALKFLLEIK